MAKIAEDYEWDQEILTSLNYQDNFDILRLKAYV